MLTADDLSLIVTGLAAVAVLCVLGCCAVVASEMRQCCDPPWRASKPRELQTFRELGPIELIGARPAHERPPGVDWTISTWASKRGQYDPVNRGFGSV